MVHQLNSEFAEAEIDRDDEALEPYLEEILRRLEGEAPHETLPLDIRATAFQRRVWEELRRIPVGETRSYAQVAAAIGSPAAVRAVGNACANNPVAIAIPCHRVLRNDGNLGGYAGELSENRLLSRPKSRELTSLKRAPEKRRKWLKSGEPGLYADPRERVVCLGWSCRKPWKTGEKYEKRRAPQARRRGAAWRRPLISI